MRHYDQGYAQYHQWQGEHLPHGDGPKKIPKLSVGHTHELNEKAEHPIAASRAGMPPSSTAHSSRDRHTRSRIRRVRVVLGSASAWRQLSGVEGKAVIRK